VFLKQKAKILKLATTCLLLLLILFVIHFRDGDGAGNPPFRETQSKLVETDKDGGIHWAGEHHPARQTFNKKKDFLADWTNVLFRP